MLDVDSIDAETLSDYEEAFIAAYQELYPAYEWSYGSLLYETVIRPTAMRAASDEDAIDAVRQNLSLALASQQTTPDADLVNSLASNFRVVEQAGLYGTGEIAVYTREQNNVYIPAGSSLSAGGVALTTDRQYVGVSNAENFVDKEDTVYRQLIQVGSEWVFLVPVRTANFTDKTVSQGLQVTMDGRPSLVTRIEISSSVLGGRAESTTADILDRAQNGLTAKVPSGNAHLKALFSELTDVNVLDQASFGINDPECIRDRDNVFGISTGGRVDAYCKTALVPSVRTLTVNATRASLIDSWSMFIDKETALGFYRIISIKHPDVNTEITDEDGITVVYGFSEESGGPHVFSADTARYSIYQTAQLTFDYTVAETQTAFEVKVQAMPALDTLQETINSPDVRNEAQDVLVRAPHPASVSVTVTVEREPGDTSTSVDDLQNAIATIISNTNIGVDGLDASLVVNAVEGVDPSLHVVFPVTLQADFQLPDSSIKTVRSLTGRVSVPDSSYTWVTEKNTFYYCLAENVSVELRDKA